MSSFLSKANLMVAQVASGDPFDRGMNAVHVEANGATVATNGKVVMAVGPVREESLRFPEVGELATVPASGLQLPVDLVTEALKNLPKDDKRPALQHVALTAGPGTAGGRVEFTAVTAGGRERRVADFPKREPFIDWKSIARNAKAEGEVRLCVNRQDLIDLLKALEAACPDRAGDNPVYLEVSPKGMLLRCQTRETGQHALGVMRGYETGEAWLERDEWEGEVLGTGPAARKGPRRL